MQRTNERTNLVRPSVCLPPLTQQGVRKLVQPLGAFLCSPWGRKKHGDGDGGGGSGGGVWDLDVPLDVPLLAHEHILADTEGERTHGNGSEKTADKSVVCPLVWCIMSIQL